MDPFPSHGGRNEVQRTGFYGVPVVGSGPVVVLEDPWTSERKRTRKDGDPLLLPTDLDGRTGPYGKEGQTPQGV